MRWRTLIFYFCNSALATISHYFWFLWDIKYVASFISYGLLTPYFYCLLWRNFFQKSNKTGNFWFMLCYFTFYTSIWGNISIVALHINIDPNDSAFPISFFRYRSLTSAWNLFLKSSEYPFVFCSDVPIFILKLLLQIPLNEKSQKISKSN